jgi:1,2-dihydroxy-3-keto-5-methylthiopentene dioxygenase
VTVLTIFDKGEKVLHTDCYFLIQEKLEEFGVGLKMHIGSPWALRFNGKYGDMDIVEMNRATENKDELRAKFMREHTHSDNEVRWFTKGRGMFGFHFGEVVFQLYCKKGDYITIPAGVKHWFDCGKDPYFRAYRYFSEAPNWVPEYTGDNIAESYQVQ